MSTAGRSTRGGRSGFTLFELIVVIAILGIAIGVVIPNISLDIGGSGVDGAVRSVQAVMDQARTHARLTRTDVTVTFNGKSAVISPGAGTFAFPDNAQFERIVFPDEDEPTTNRLIVDRRGVTPVSIVRMKVDDQIYSLLINAVMRDVEYRKGIAHFEEFTE